MVRLADGGQCPPAFRGRAESNTCPSLRSYPLFEFFYLQGSEAVGFGDDWNHIGFILEGLHELHVDRTKPAGEVG